MMTARRLLSPELLFALASFAVEGEERFAVTENRTGTPESATWPQFRGPGARGLGQGTNLPQRWATNLNVAWKTEVPGRGWSSPVVWGNKIFLTAVVNDGEIEAPRKGLHFGGEQPALSKVNHHYMVDCLGLNTGKFLWQKEVHQGPPTTLKHLKNSYASETPVSDGERVYAYFGNVGLYCLDFDANVLWSRKWGPFQTRNGWGTAASPVLCQDRLYVVNDNEEESFLVALDKRTGRQIWRVERSEKTNWATPFVWENDQRTELVVPGSGKVLSYDAEGKVLWELGGMSGIDVPTPFAGSGLLYVCSGQVGAFQRPIFAIRPGAAGDITLKAGETKNAFIAWCQKMAGPYNPSPVACDGYLYVLYDFGFLACFEARSGKEIYGQQRLNTEGTSSFLASPWAYQGNVFCLSDDGDTFVIQAGPTYKLLGKNSLNDMCLATPAIAQNSVLLRSASSLYRLRN